jgi:hypothetical protein
LVRSQYQGVNEDPTSEEVGPRPIQLPQGYDPHWRVSLDRNAQQFISELEDLEYKSKGLFLSKCIDFGFTPDKAMKMYYHDRLWERALVNGFLTTGESQEMFGLLGSPKGLKWLRTGNNLELFFYVMRIGFGGRGDQ